MKEVVVRDGGYAMRIRMPYIRARGQGMRQILCFRMVELSYSSVVCSSIAIEKILVVRVLGPCTKLRTRS